MTETGNYIIQEKPDNNLRDDIISELVFHQMIQRGLADSEAGRTISNDAMQHRIRTWRNQESAE